MNCQKCGAPISTAVKFCGKCGAKNGIKSVETDADTVICKNCGNKFKKIFGVCPTCGEPVQNNNFKEGTENAENDGGIQEPSDENFENRESVAEKTSVKQSEARQSKPKFENYCNGTAQNENSSYANGKGNEVPKKPVGVRGAALEYIQTKSYYDLIGQSGVILLIYPVLFLISLLIQGSGFSDFIYSIKFLLQIISLFGVLLCFAKSQSDRLAAASTVMAICYIIKGARDSFNFDYISKIVFYAALCIVCIKDYLALPAQRASGSSARGGKLGGIQIKWLLISVLIAVGILGIIMLFSGKTCDKCGKFTTEYYEVFGKTFCKNCLYS